MTATTRSKRGFLRITSMESLGFMDAPSRSWSTPPPHSAEPGAASTQISALVSVPTGRHSRNGHPTGELVTDMWETTELHAPSLEDWSPQAFGSKHLGGRRFRWPMLLLTIAVTLAVSGVGYWLYRQPADAATAANWTNTSVVTATIETTNSNPAALVADNEQGGKLFLVYTKTDGKLYYTHDQASDSWVAEQELHPGTKTVGAISGGVMMDAIGVCYLDTAPVTDDLKFDSL